MAKDWKNERKTRCVKIVLQNWIRKKCKEKGQKCKKLYNKKNWKTFLTQKNFLKTPSMCLSLFNSYAPMHKFCACYIYSVIIFL